MKMKELMEMLKGYSGDADVCVVVRQDDVKSYYRIVELQVVDWGTEFELIVKED